MSNCQSVKKKKQKQKRDIFDIFLLNYLTKPNTEKNTIRRSHTQLDRPSSSSSSWPSGETDFSENSFESIQHMSFKFQFPWSLSCFQALIQEVWCLDFSISQLRLAPGKGYISFLFLFLCWSVSVLYWLRMHFVKFFPEFLLIL